MVWKFSVSFNVSRVLQNYFERGSPFPKWSFLLDVNLEENLDGVGICIWVIQDQAMSQ
jgi:hypothetical protein